MINFNYIKFTRPQIIFFIVIFLLISAISILDKCITRKKYIDESPLLDSTTLAEFIDFENHLETICWNSSTRQIEKVRNTYIHREHFHFDPNTIDSIGMLKLGFQPYMAHNLLNYRRHGGKIFDIEKFREIYGIDTLLIDSLSSLITFDSAKRTIKDTVVNRYIPKTYFSFDINCSDTSLLKKLPNIGIGRASMIVSYRNRLGGFYSIKQLYEIEGIPKFVIDSIALYAVVNLDSIKKIDVNKSNIKRLKKHPYINYYQAKAIYELRWDGKHKGILHKDDLYEISDFSEDYIEKILHYLEFR